MDLAESMKRLEETVARLADANTVTSASVLSHEERIKEHEEWLRQNELALVRHREFLAQHEAMMAALDTTLKTLADLILKGRTGNGSG